MRTKALGAKPSVEAASASRFASGRYRLNSRPPPPAAPACRNFRREIALAAGARPGPTGKLKGFGNTLDSLSLRMRCVLDGLANADIGATATDIAGHRGVDLGIGWIRVARQERRRRHDLTRLAVTALHHLAVKP